MLSGIELVIGLVAVFVGATVMGTVSFGMGLVVAPVLLLFLEPQSAVVTVNVIIGLVCACVLFQTRRNLDLRRVGPMALGGLIAVPFGVLALSVANPTLLRVTIAAVILVLGVFHLFDIPIPMTGRRYSGPVFGFFCSLSITTLSIGGPLAAIYVMAQQWSSDTMRASLSFFFLTTYLLAFGLYVWAGLVTVETLANIGLLAPGLLAGFGVATLIVKRINERVFRYAAIGVILTGSTVLLVREVTPL